MLAQFTTCFPISTCLQRNASVPPPTPPPPPTPTPGKSESLHTHPVGALSDKPCPCLPPLHFPHGPLPAPFTPAWPGTPEVLALPGCDPLIPPYHQPPSHQVTRSRLPFAALVPPYKACWQRTQGAKCKPLYSEFPHKGTGTSD